MISSGLPLPANPEMISTNFGLRSYSFRSHHICGKDSTTAKFRPPFSQSSSLRDRSRAMFLPLENQSFVLLLDRGDHGCGFFSRSQSKTTLFAFAFASCLVRIDASSFGLPFFSSSQVCTMLLVPLVLVQIWERRNHPLLSQRLRDLLWSLFVAGLSVAGL